MQADAAAEKHLASFGPSLRGRGAIVNIGAFTCTGSGLNELLQTHELTMYDSDLDC